MTEHPNVLLLVFDTARADAFAPHRDTPTVAQLAADGTSYARAIAPSCWTLPSHASMFLGAPPRSVGLSRRPPEGIERCAPIIERQRDRFLPDVLHRAGYATAGISTNLWIAERTGFTLGFDRYEEPVGDRVRKMAEGGLRARASWYLDALRARVDDGATAVERLMADWLAERPRGPFFWFVNLIECHSPYLPPRPYNDLGPLGRIAAAEDARRYQTLEAVMRAAATGDGPPPGAARRMRHLYDRSIDLLDAWLARICELLDATGCLDETVIVVTSDHGENFGESGLLGHAGSLDDRLLRVPLVLAGPGVDRGRAVSEVTSLCALPAMIGDAAGIDHPWNRGENIAVAQYDGPVHTDRLSTLDAWEPTPDGRRRLVERFTCATDGRLKLVRGESGEWLYDLEADPLERSSVDPTAYADRLGSLRGAIDAALADAWDPPPDLEAPEAADDTADLEERMRLLGYL